jgi:hypothetical protein
LDLPFCVPELGGITLGFVELNYKKNGFFDTNILDSQYFCTEIEIEHVNNNNRFAK